MTTLLDQAKHTETDTDQTEATTGGQREVAPEGMTPARLISYIECGSHVGMFEGQETKTKPMVRLKFQLLGKQHKHEFEVDGEKRVAYNTIDTREMPLSSNEKAGFFKLLMKMIAGRDGIKTMADMLGEPFLINIVHNKSKDGKKTYANMKVDGEWKIQGPMLTVPENDENGVPTGEMKTVKVPVPEIHEPERNLQLFIWERPTNDMWKSIFIDGTFTRKDEKGNETEVSKNFLQERIMEATNFEGSPIYDMLNGAGELNLTPNTLEDGDAATEKPQESDEVVEATEDTPEPEIDPDDPLAALGLEG